MTNETGKVNAYRWAQSLATLLQDQEGVNLFRRFVEDAGGIHKDLFEIYFASEGLRQQTDPETIKKLHRLITRK